MKWFDVIMQDGSIVTTKSENIYEALIQMVQVKEIHPSKIKGIVETFER